MHTGAVTILAALSLLLGVAATPVSASTVACAVGYDQRDAQLTLFVKGCGDVGHFYRLYATLTGPGTSIVVYNGPAGDNDVFVKTYTLSAGTYTYTVVGTETLLDGSQEIHTSSYTIAIASVAPPPPPPAATPKPDPPPPAPAPAPAPPAPNPATPTAQPVAPAPAPSEPSSDVSSTAVEPHSGDTDSAFAEGDSAPTGQRWMLIDDRLGFARSAIVMIAPQVESVQADRHLLATASMAPTATPASTFAPGGMTSPSSLPVVIPILVVMVASIGGLVALRRKV